MSMSYAATAARTFQPDPQQPIMEELFQQYERVLMESLITSFGLDFLVRDQHGGDVDTIHNVRQIGKDGQMTFKNKQNEAEYNNRGEYNSAQYHKTAEYVDKNKRVHEQRDQGTLNDAYTGQQIKQNEKIDLDHVVSAKEIHDDPGRVIAGIRGEDLANREKNLCATDRSINRSKRNQSVEDFLKQLEKTEPSRAAELKQLRSKPRNTLTDLERAKLHKLEELASVDKEKTKRLDQEARQDIDSKVNITYYTSTKFAKDLTLAAGSVGLRMGARQALGFVFAEMWFSVKEEFQDQQGEFELGEFFSALGRGIQRGYARAKEKYAELISKFFSGALSGAMASLTTTLCNIFFTTAKNVVKVIRQSYASLVEAGKVLFINPDNYPFGERMRAVIKILATGASVVAGALVSEALEATPIGRIPVLGDIVQAFCGAFVTGILSCTFLYFLDRSELMNKLFKCLDDLHTIKAEVNYYRQQAEYFEQYATELMRIDLAQFQREAALYSSISTDLETAENDRERKAVLMKAYEQINAAIPWKGYGSFDEFMEDKNSRLVFG